MTIDELINELKKFPKDKEVFIWEFRSMQHIKIDGCRQFTEKNINHHLMKEDEEYRDDINKILNNVVLYFTD